MDLSLETTKRRSVDSLPEFEFWMVGNPSYPQQELLTADELFVDGVLLPLHLLSVVHSEPDAKHELAETSPDPSPPPPPQQQQQQAIPPLERSSASILSSPSSGSKRWRDIFRVGEKKGNEKERPRRESKGNAAELNINIWPFSRSRSAGNGGATSSRSRTSSMAGRKASSAPCSRSNSRGESSKHSGAGAGATRKWAASPGRAGVSGGVHLGRTSPVWQIRRGEKRTEPAAYRGPAERANQRDKVTGGKKGSGFGGGVRVLNLNVNTCIGYRNQVSCRGNDKDGVTGSVRTASEEGSGGNGSLFSLRSFFSKKVY